MLIIVGVHTGKRFMHTKKKLIKIFSLNILFVLLKFRPIDLRQPYAQMSQYSHQNSQTDDVQNENEPRNLSMRYPNRFPSESIMNENMLGVANAIQIQVPADLSTPPANEPNQNDEPQPLIATPEMICINETHSNASTSNLEINLNSNVSNENQSSRMHTMNGLPHHHPPVRHQPGGRCPYASRRLSTTNYHNFHPANMRPAYAPHEMLWFRQQNNQEMLRRHYMNSMSGGITEPTPSSSFGYVANRMNTNGTIANGVCMQCDQQHPIGHPHHRRVRPHVCPLNLVCFCFFFLLIFFY